MVDNMEALMNLMGIDMTRGLKATLFMTNIDEAEVVLKVWLEECNWKEYPAVTLAQVQYSLSFFLSVIEGELNMLNVT